MANIHHLRSFAGEADLPRIVAMINQCASADPMENATSIEELRSDIARPAIDSQNDVVVVEQNDRIVGFAAILIPTFDQKIETHLWMHTAHDASESVDRLLLEWFVARAGAISLQHHKAVEMLASAAESKLARRAVLESLGFSAARYFFRMARSLDEATESPVFPAGYQMRALLGEEEMPEWVAAFNESFVDHWHFSPLTLDRALQFVQQDPNYRLEGELVAIAPSGEIGGFCQCIIRANENGFTGRREGWIALLGTRRGHRKIGLGKAMLLGGLRWLKQQGMDRALLGVDGSNPTGALGLYESAGFRVVHRRIAWSKSCPVVVGKTDSL